MEIPGKPSAGMHQSTLDVWIFTLWNQNLEPPPSHVFFLLYPFNTNVNVIIQNTLTSSEHHHMMLWWHHTSFLVGIHVHAPGMLSGDPHSECVCFGRLAHPPFVESEMATPGTYHDTLTQVPKCAPLWSLPGKNLLKHIKIELTTNGMINQRQLKSITKINWASHLAQLIIWLLTLLSTVYDSFRFWFWWFSVLGQVWFSKS